MGKYITQSFTDNETILESSHLNHIESGIVQNETAINKLQIDVSQLNENLSQLSANGFSETLITRYEPVNKSIFKGKKLWVFGDSITAGVGTDSAHYFSQILCDNLGCASLKRLGNSGYAFSHGLENYGSCILDKIESSLATAPGNCDILIICFGVNDWTWGRNIAGDRAIGNLLDTTKYTICGAVNLFCQKLQNIFKDYPDVKIYFSTPTPTKNAPISGGNPSKKSWDQSKKNFNGNTLRDICSAIIKTASLYGYQTLDLNLYFDGDINDTAAMDIAFPDGLHPSAEGNEKMAITLEKLMCANPITTFNFNPIVNTLSPLAKNLIYKEIKSIEAETPIISVQPASNTYKQNAVPQALTVSASVNDGGELSYQWYKNNVIITTATNNSYIPSTDSIGSYNYYCMITNTLNNSKKSIKSNTATITIDGDLIIDDIEVVDLTNLTFNHIKLDDATGENNLFYQQSDQTLSVDSTGWDKSSYANTPLKVGNEIEITTYFGDTTGNAILIYSEEDIATPAKIASAFWPSSTIFGLYASGADTASETLFIWDTEKVALNGYAATVLNGGKKLKLRLLNTGVELYINENKIVYDNPKILDNSKTYYFGMHMNSSIAGTLGTKIEYIGPIR